MANNRDPIYRRIRADLAERIDSGSWLPGMQLPSEARLAADWGTSRHSVRSALLALAEDGLVLRRAGRGWFVRDRRRGRSGRAGHVAVVADLDPALLAPIFADLDLGCVLALPGAEHERRISAAFLAELLAERGCRGVLLNTMRRLPPEVLAPLAEAKLPLVLVGLPEHVAGHDSVAPDFAAASRRLVHAAAAAGHAEVAFLGRGLHAELPPFVHRVEGYRLAMAELERRARVWLLPPERWSGESIPAWFAERLAADPAVDACLLDSSHTAACLAALHRLRPIPSRLLVAGYGNGPTPLPSLPVASFTAVYEPWDACHQLGAQRLLARIAGDRSPPCLTLLPCRLIPGESLPLD